MATTEESRVIGKHTYHVGDQVVYTYSSPENDGMARRS